MEKKPQGQRLMGHALRPMDLRDIGAVAEIEREGFPTTWPPTPFRKELSNRLARYLVATPHRAGDPDPASPPSLVEWSLPRRRGLRGLAGRLLGPRQPEDDGSLPPEPLSGFVGLWFMADEVHITAIASRKSHRGQGIGELLLIGAVELAMARGSCLVTLEVRVSNHVAQALYQKYGLKETGVRKRYYTDNNEDALLMSTAPLSSPEYQALFRWLVDEHGRRWGSAPRVLP